METFEFTDFVTLLAVLVFVIGLMCGFAFLMKRLGLAQGVVGINTNRRINIVESLPLDNRRRAVILRCDEHEHLVILGPESEIVVKTDLETPKTQDLNKRGSDHA